MMRMEGLPMLNLWQQILKTLGKSRATSELAFTLKDQFEKYYSIPAGVLRSDGIQTTVYGNWLNISPERKTFHSKVYSFQELFKTKHVQVDKNTIEVNPRYIEVNLNFLYLVKKRKKR